MVFIFDLDGVLYRGDMVIKKAPETVDELRRRGHRVFFITNNSLRTREQFAEKLRRLGIKCSLAEVMNSGYATMLYFKEKGITEANLFIIGEKGLKEELAKTGLKIVEVNEEVKIDYVVVGLDRDFHYRMLAKAQKAIIKGAEFIATNDDPVLPLEEGVIPGAGAIIAALKTCTKVTPFMVGKPSTFMLEIILKETKTEPKDLVVVGDRLDSDILAGRKLGAKTVLVLTGITRKEQALLATGDLKPDYIIEEISGLLILKLEGSQ